MLLVYENIDLLGYTIFDNIKLALSKVDREGSYAK